MSGFGNVNGHFLERRQGRVHSLLGVIVPKPNLNPNPKRLLQKSIFVEIF